MEAAEIVEKTVMGFDHEQIPVELGARLRRVLVKIGYGDFWASLLPNTQLDLAISSVANTLEPQRKLEYMLLAGGRSEEVADIDRELLSNLRALIPCGLVIESEGRIQLRGLRLMVLSGLTYFAQLSSGHETLYFGTDSLALSMRLASEPNEKVVDYCAGPGIQSLFSASRGASVVAVEANSIAAELARCNFALNNLAGDIGVLTGSVQDHVLEPCSVDRIVSNPPLLAIPEGFSYPFVGDGGPDGLRIVREILKKAEISLKPGGQAQVIGTTIGNEDGPFAFRELQNWCSNSDFRAVLTVMGSLTTSETGYWTESLARSILLFQTGHGDKEFADVKAELASAYRDLGGTHIFTFHLRVFRPFEWEAREQDGQNVVLVDLASVPGNDSFWWFRDCQERLCF